MTSDPYGTLVLLAEREHALVDDGRVEDLAALAAERDALVATLPAQAAGRRPVRPWSAPLGAPGGHGRGAARVAGRDAPAARRAGPRARRRPRLRRGPRAPAASRVDAAA